MNETINTSKKFKVKFVLEENLSTNFRVGDSRVPVPHTEKMSGT